MITEHMYRAEKQNLYVVGSWSLSVQLWYSLGSLPLTAGTQSSTQQTRMLQFPTMKKKLFSHPCIKTDSQVEPSEGEQITVERNKSLENFSVTNYIFDKTSEEIERAFQVIS